ncbi:MAG: nitrilase-related carbon-nitrogen hydrolase [Flavobacteriales bacterium]
MKVLGLEMNMMWSDPMGNLATVEALLPEIISRKPDLVVLPEMWSTGFTMSPEKIQLNALGQAQAAVARWSHETQAAWYGSTIALEANGKFKNRGFFVTPDGSNVHYDKRHLFTFGKEPDHYAPGNNKVIVKYQGWRILLQICYDLRFPVFSRNAGNEPWDLALYVANWPAVRSKAWSILLQARAIENCAYVVGINRWGEDGNGVKHTGDSAVMGPRGEREFIAGTNVQMPCRFLESRLDWAELQSYRSKFPALNDADPFTLDL